MFVKTRKYWDREIVGIGDVVKVCDGPFCSAVVTDHNKEVIFCERVHVSVDAFGQLSIGVERLKYSRGDFLKNIEVFCKGPMDHIDNRLRKS